MTLIALPFPAIDPILIQIGPLAIRWYALSYIIGLVLAWRIIRILIRNPRLWSERKRPVASEIDDYFVWATVGIILGGRVGFVLFYNPMHYLANPMEIPMVWRGGMSFHGGLAGILISTIWYARKIKLSYWVLFDLIAIVAPLGLMFGRIANFINSELWGRVSTVPWAIVFPDGGPEPRHPSQLYEAFFEGLLLFCVMLWLAYSKKKLSQVGFLSGVFGIGYGSARIFCELFREPDTQIGFLFAGSTMGMMLTIPVIVCGILILFWSFKRLGNS